MNPELIFIPVLIQIALTLVIYIRLGQAKEAALKKGEVDKARRGLYDDAWPESVRKINNNIRNQFETPILFYVLIILLWLLESTNTITQLVALAYAISRVIHAYVHIVNNYITLRKRLFQFGVALLIILTALAILAIVF